MPGETLSSENLQHFCGGKGLNQSIALARAGANVYHAGAIGEDGMVLKKQLEEDGVDISYLKIRESVGTGHAIIQVDEKGQNCILLYGGANQSITKEQVDDTLKNFQAGDYLLLQNEINELAYIMEQAGRIGMKIFLNPSPCNEIIDSLPLDLVDTFLLNEIEGEQISGEKEKILDAMFERYPNAHIILTLGSEGAVYGWKGQQIFQKAEKVTAVDTTAAGDTFTGYYLAAVSAGKEAAEALQLASRAAAIAVTRQGAVPSIPYQRELL